jgi:hypothetical protein
LINFTIDMIYLALSNFLIHYSKSFIKKRNLRKIIGFFELFF